MKIQNFIAGEFHDSQTQQSLPNYCPINGQEYGCLPRSSAADVEHAVTAATAAAGLWSSLSQSERSRYLMAIADIIAKRAEEFAQAETRDTGKPIELSRTVDVPRSIANFRFFASAGEQFSTESHINQNSINFTRRDPLGIVGCISPWNLPLYLLSWKVAPALTVGNTVIAKPSEITPATAQLLAEVCQEVQLPPGVLNIVHGLGPEVGQSIVEHSAITAITFTGGTATGQAINLATAKQFKKLSLEMGGKNPNIIFADCRLAKAVNSSVKAAFRNQGQICLCGSRILIEESLYDQFKEKFVTAVKNLVIGDPRQSAVDLGAIVSESHYNKILAAIEKSVAEGGNILTGGKAWHGDGDIAEGWYIEPTVIEGLGARCQTNQEEIFGPVVTLDKFSTEDQALVAANGTRYGLAASVWTQDLDRAMRFSQKIHSGIVWVNTWMNRDLRTPFGGTKQSGLGREGGWDVLRFMTESKNVCIEFEG